MHDPGDLLGDHWPLDESLPVLLDLARTARFVAGRAGVLHGLSEAASRSTGTALEQIRAVLRERADSDPSPTIRAAAGRVLKGIGSRKAS